MGSPFVSVVTPSYNQAEFIEDTIRSVIDQDGDDVEHVVVDGGSDDGTVGILEEYEDRYDLRWVSESDRGQTHAINKGIRMSDGDWIGWLNSDDMYSEDAVDCLDRATSRYPDADVVYGDLRFVDRDGEEIFRRYHTRPSSFIQSYYTPFTGNHCTFFRSRVFEELGVLNEDLEFAMDIDLYTRILESDMNCVHYPSVMGEHRIHDDAKTGEHHDAMREEMHELLRSDPTDATYPIGKATAFFLKLTYILGDGLDPRKFEGLDWSAEAIRYEIARPIYR